MTDSTIALIERLAKEADNMQFNEDLDSMDDGIALMREAATELTTLLAQRDEYKRDYHLVAQERDNLTHDLGKVYEQRASLLQRVEKAEAAYEELGKEAMLTADVLGKTADGWMERCELAERQRDEALKAANIKDDALAIANTALEDWLHKYAPDECKECYVQATSKRISEAGGTLAYLADVFAVIRAARDAGGKQ